MSPETLDLLQKADDANLCEYPANFDRDETLKRIIQIKPFLEKLLNNPLLLDDQIQDASFFATLIIKQFAQEQEADGYAIITFSCFGNLFTTWNSLLSKYFQPQILTQVVEEIKKAGFSYVDEASLEELYTGQNPFFEGLTWQNRFFDYL